ncbi:hypothetical protein [Pseudoduganella lutea]|uniref:Uncharacterized protein n=1 Tax=Pseudoduganella lutea TaxID=321985 RepID=A0A4P6L2E6_9BURK|nr:hypothetical protein [Pseudoduganella lutea]QBE65435.1 hypothetical protein EWM63_22610 [Pseudoduganella lutea]
MFAVQAKTGVSPLVTPAVNDTADTYRGQTPATLTMFGVGHFFRELHPENVSDTGSPQEIGNITHWCLSPILICRQNGDRVSKRLA